MKSIVKRLFRLKKEPPQNGDDETRMKEDDEIEIGSALCRDLWLKIIDFCDTTEWLQLSYTCKGINQFKFNRLLMCNKKRTLKRNLNEQEIEYWFRLAKGTLFNVQLNKHSYVMDEHFQFLEGVHTLDMSYCNNITDNAFSYLRGGGIHSLDMSGCNQTSITDNSISHLAGIHTLDIGLCQNITTDAFSHLSGIHTLNMGGCYHISDNAFSYLTGIHTLDMSECNQITDDVFRHLVGIHTLDMSYCKTITGDGFCHLTGIHTLLMYGCKVTDQAFSHLIGIHKLGK